MNPAFGNHAPSGELGGRVAEGEVVYLAWSDYVGLLRCRGVPLSELPKRMEYGLGWAVAGQALTPFDDIAPNPWGPMLRCGRRRSRRPRPASISGMTRPPITSSSAIPRWRTEQLGLLRARLHAGGAGRFRARDRPQIHRLLRARVPAERRRPRQHDALLHRGGAHGGALHQGCGPGAAASGGRPRDRRARIRHLPVRDHLRAGRRRHGRRPCGDHPRSHPRSRAAPRLPCQLHAEAGAEPGRQRRPCAFQLPGRRRQQRGL